MKKYCLIGKNLGHTLSPTIHSEFGLIYDVCELNNDNQLKAFIKKQDYSGFNVTIPYKQAIMPFLHKVDSVAKKIGAVNTVVNLGGKLYGYNTDILGLSYALSKAKISIENKKVMILGSGGASKTAQYLCSINNASEIIIVSRQGKVNYKSCYDYIDTQVIINTTPVGMFPDSYSCPIDIKNFKKLDGVFDMVYNPLNTMLIQQANNMKLNADNGLSMLVAQAKFSRDLFLNNKLSNEVIDNIKNKIFKDKINIVFIGMPASGKTSLGKGVAKALGREFIDTDEIIKETINMSIAEYFEAYGEKAFRDLEKEVIAKVSKKLNVIISTGGGAILCEQNRKALLSNSKVILIERDLKKLSLIGRPLSKSYESLLKMKTERNQLYYEMADYVIYNNENLENAVKEAVDIYNNI